jgi:hypothetical protein
MVGDAALARTVVVKNVTEPNPALLHKLPRSVYLLAGSEIEQRTRIAFSGGVG